MFLKKLFSKKTLAVLTAVVLCVVLCTAMIACGDQKTTKKSSGKKSGKLTTLENVGYPTDETDEDYIMKEFVTLDQIYFPDGLFDTGFGMFIWDYEGDKWVRSNEHHELLDATRPTFVYIHGMGGNGSASDPAHYYERGFNVLSFAWGAYCGEDNAHFATMAEKVWYRCGGRWMRNLLIDDDNPEWEEEDVSDYSVAEMFCAFYYDIMGSVSEYSGSSIEIYGHSYGGMMTIATTSLLTTAYRAGLLPASLLPDMCTVLDPYLMNVSRNYKVPWLCDYMPVAGKNSSGNMAEICNRTAKTCRELGITFRMLRTNETVAYPVTLSDGNNGNTVESYWKFVDQLIYTELTKECIAYFADTYPGMTSYLPHLHNFARDWYPENDTGAVLYDSNAKLTKEEAFCFNMAYDTSYARGGVKYLLDCNETEEILEDDIITSQNIEKAKICGFVYYDRDGDGELDERIRDHLSGATVTVTDADGNEILSAVTTINGYYEIEVDKTGEYTIAVTLPKGLSFSAEGTEEATVNIIDPVYQCAITHFGATK